MNEKTYIYIYISATNDLTARFTFIDEWWRGVTAVQDNNDLIAVAILGC
jgi:hypothetical protein